jgi:hypothetical protein
VKSTINTKWLKSALILKSEDSFNFEALPIPRSIQLHKIKDELSVVMQHLRNLPNEPIENLEHREYVDIEYHTRRHHSRIYDNNLKMPCPKIVIDWCGFPDNISPMKAMQRASKH